MDKIKIYIEGGSKKGQKYSSFLNRSLKQAFEKLLREYGINAKQYYQIVAGGCKDETIKAIDTKTKLAHLEKKKSKESLKGITENNLFFMVVCMESWIVSDAEALKKYYGSGFKETKIQASDLIHKDKTTIEKMIKDSIKECKNNEYKKSEAFKILEKASVQKIVESNSYAKEFFEFLKSKIPN